MPHERHLASSSTSSSCSSRPRWPPRSRNASGCRRSSARSSPESSSGRRSSASSVGSDDVLRTLGELGVDPAALAGRSGDGPAGARPGRPGVADGRDHRRGRHPLLLGLGAMELRSATTSRRPLFVASALTATSVGITARVFGDLRALGDARGARIVLGAAVADDVMGLVVLTVVVRLVTEGSVSLLIRALASSSSRSGSSSSGGYAALRLAPPLFGSSSTCLALDGHPGGVGARVHARLRGAGRRREAGADRRVHSSPAWRLRRSEQSERISRELAPVGHLFIPVFFLQIGIDAQCRASARRACSGTRRSCWSSPSSESWCRPSGRSARRATSSSSVSACCLGARSASSSPPSGCHRRPRRRSVRGAAVGRAGDHVGHTAVTEDAIRPAST